MNRHIVIKDHVPYEWSAAKMQRYQELFFDVDYEVTEQAPYGRELASNPFRVFQEIPADSRYRFMLDDARFYIQGFIKGPVCRGQIALDVIADQFWIVFADPTMAELSTNQAFLKQATNYLELPARSGQHARYVGYLDRLLETREGIPETAMDRFRGFRL